MTRILIELVVFIGVPTIVLVVYSSKPQLFEKIKLDGKKAVVVGVAWIAVLFVIPLLLDFCIGGR